MSFGMIPVTYSMYSSQFTPLSLTNVVNWLDGDNPTNTVLRPPDFAALSLWVDKSPFALNFTQGTGANEPLYRTNIVGTLGSISFDGVNDYFSRVNTPNLQSTNTTLASVVTTNIFDTNFRSYSTMRTGAAPLYGYAFYRNPNNVGPDSNLWSGLMGNGGGGWSFPATGPAITLNTPTLIVMNVVAGVASYYVNGTLYGSGAYDGGSGVVTPTHFLGCGGNDATPGLYWRGFMHERIVRSVGSTAAELSLLTNYLKQRWGIS